MALFDQLNNPTPPGSTAPDSAPAQTAAPMSGGLGLPSQPSSTRAQQLTQLAQQLPAANQQIANGLQQARTTQLQQTVAQMRPGASNVQTAQNLGTQQAQAAGQINLQANQQTQNQLQSVGQMGQQAQGRALRQQASQNQIQLDETQRQLGDKLNNIDQSAKKQILDDTLNFKLDEAGRALLDTRQLADWSVMNATSAQDLANKEQDLNQAYDRKIQMMQTAQNRLEQIVKQGYYSNKQPLDQASRMKIEQQREGIQLQIQQEQAKRTGQMTMYAAGGGIIGGAIGVGAAIATGGAAAPYIPAAIGAGSALGTTAGASKS